MHERLLIFLNLQKSVRTVKQGVRMDEKLFAQSIICSNGSIYTKHFGETLPFEIKTRSNGWKQLSEQHENDGVFCTSVPMPYLVHPDIILKDNLKILPW